MKAASSFLKVIASLGLGLLFLALLLGTLALYMAENKLLEEDFYKKHLEESQFYSRLYSEVLGQIESAAPFYGDLKLSPAEVQGLVTQVFPQDWVQQQVEAMLDSLLPWISSETEALEMAIDLRPNKQVAQEVVARFVREKVGGLRECPPGQGVGLGDLSQGVFPECLPRDGEALRAEVMASAISVVAESIGQAPDHLDLLEEVTGQSRQEFLEKFQGLRSGLKLATRVFLPLSSLALAILLLFIALLHRPRLRSGLRWVGGTLLFSGLFLLAGFLYATRALPSRISDMVAENTATLPGDVMALITEVLERMLRDLMGGLLFPAAVVSALGLALFLLSLLLPQRKPPPHARS